MSSSHHPRRSTAAGGSGGDGWRGSSNSGGGGRPRIGRKRTDTSDDAVLDVPRQRQQVYSDEELDDGDDLAEYYPSTGAPPVFVRSSETEPEPYVPLSMDSGFARGYAAARGGATDEEDIEDQPSSSGVSPVSSPRALKGLTGKISTLFRRTSDHHPQQQAASGAAVTAGGSQPHPSSASHSQRRISGDANNNSKSLAGYRTPPPSSTGGLSPRSLASSVDPAGLTPPGRSSHDEPGATATARTAAARTSGKVTSPASAASSMTSAGDAGGMGARNAVIAMFQKGAGQRIFYSSHADDSDDSYESRLNSSRSGGLVAGKPAAPAPVKVTSSSPSSGRGGRKLPFGRGRRDTSNVYSTDDAEDDAGDDDEYDETTQTTYDELASPRIVRFRGFSTSIKSLFLDEALVCSSMGCFGLLLSNRTEYLLTLRNERRGTLSPRNGERRHKLPSKVVAYGLLLTVLLMFSTFLIWGFGTGHGLANYAYSGYDTAFDNIQADDTNSNNGNYNYNDNRYADDQRYANQQYDDGGGGDDANNKINADDFYDDGNGNNRRKHRQWQRRDASVSPPRAAATTVVVDEEYTGLSNRISHPLNGIAKLRDMHENVWEPLWYLVQSEWYRANDEPERTAGDTRKVVGDDAAMQRWRHKPPRDLRDGGISYYDVVADDSLEMKYTKQQRDIGANIRTALLFTFLVFLGILGRRRRMRTRFYLVRARAQEDHLYYASAQVGSIKSINSPGSPSSPNSTQAASYEALDRENQYEGACSHTLCGCYPVDEVTYEEAGVEEVKVNDWGIQRRKKRPHHEDIVARSFNCCMAACCGVICKCWFQCLSICALAQEAREIRLLLPTRYQRIDFITHQPFHEYHQNVTDLRLGWMGKTRRMTGILPHYNALSRLSRYIVVTGSLAVVAIVATLIFNPRAAFSWQDAVVLAATFVTSFLVLFIVHWIFHKSDLSLDAVIKLFAAGFLIAVPSACFFEALVVNVVGLVAWSTYKVGELSMGDAFSAFIFDHWRMIWIFVELFNAYVVAAITEELCKYYTFRAVEHPDLVFLTGLDREDHDGEGAVAGGVVRYPFSSHQVSVMNRDDESVSQRSTRSRSSHRSNRSNAMKRKPYSNRGLEDGLIDDRGDFKIEEPDVRTHRQRAMAITTGMISVAVGLACAENMLYVFVLGGAMANDKGGDLKTGDVIEAWIILFVRSIFPIHALSAAMQSIGMIRKFVETTDHNGHRIGIGRIILPAVILHGSFDAVLLGITVYSETAWDMYLEANNGRVPEDGTPYNPVILNLVAAMSVVAIMVIGIVWYFRENRLQSKRLKELEEMEKAKWLSSSPLGDEADPRPGDMELV